MFSWDFFIFILGWGGGGSGNQTFRGNSRRKLIILFISGIRWFPAEDQAEHEVGSEHLHHDDGSKSDKSADPGGADPDPSPILQKTNPQKKPESNFDLTKSKSQFFSINISRKVCFFGGYLIWMLQIRPKYSDP